MARSEQDIPKRGRRAVPWRRDAEILARLRHVERRHLRRIPNTQIAVELGVDEKTIRNDLVRLRELWIEHIQGEQAQLRAGIVAELDDTAERALAAAEFDEQCERDVLYGADRLDADGIAVRVYRDEKGSAKFTGQKAQHLNVRRQAVMDKAKVLGLVADKVDASGEVLVRIYERETPRGDDAGTA